ncbi:Signal peptidase I [hydrothermal vent metagenome]|uniref:signal peptidase I n=1 Tax=hydrothermal vent metagenome TaxID=652676 RepID=A0A3B1BND3_9ZZZZ
MEYNRNTEGAARAHTIGDFFITIFIAFTLAFFIRTCIAQAYEIPSESMEETLLVGDKMFVEKVSTYFGSPERGDILVFKNPYGKGPDFVKRVIGLPGETLLLKHETVYINGAPLDEPYAVYRPNVFRNHDDGGFGPVKIPEGSLFMMGDNRNNSADSRAWGPLDMTEVIGKAMVIHWSREENSHIVRWNRIGKLFN